MKLGKKHPALGGHSPGQPPIRSCNRSLALAYSDSPYPSQ
jgi:hypothetical protein